MSFDTKYRPLNFDDVVGQKGTVEVLRKLITTGQVFDKSYIFAGPSGTGKTTTARILARSMLCDDVDSETGEPCNKCQSCQEIISGSSSFSFVEMDAANNSGADRVRQIVKDIDYYTLGGNDRRIYLIDECFTEDTELMTEEGLQSIRTLVEQKYKGKVLSYDTEEDTVVWKRVTDWFDIPDERETLRLTFDNGVEIIVTIDQELYTTNRGWVKACELTEDDDICETQFSKVDLPSHCGESYCLCGCGQKLTPFDSRKIRRRFISGHGGNCSIRCKMAKLIKSEKLGKKKVYDVTVEDTHSFFAASTQGRQTHAVLAHNCHRLSPQAMDALLKPMEDNLPGTSSKRLVCLFCTTEPEKIRNTIKARCMMFGIKEPEKEEAVSRLRWISDQEGINYTEEALDLVFSHGRGQIRDMVNALERVSQIGDVTVDNTKEQLGLGAVSNYYEILNILRDDLPQALSLTQETLRMVDPPALYEGLADAAMASYRASWDILEGIGYVDRDLANEIFNKYGEDSLWIADRILGSNKQIDENVLTCETVIMHRYLNNGNIISGNNVQDVRGSNPVRKNQSTSSSSAENSELSPSNLDGEKSHDKKDASRFKDDAKDLSKTGHYFVNPKGPSSEKSNENDTTQESPKTKTEMCRISGSEARELNQNIFDD